MSGQATIPGTDAAELRLLVTAPRGYCAGVNRAIQTVERALELHGPPVYVRKEIVHNKHVVDRLRAAGIDELGLLTEQLPPNQQNPPKAGGD